MRAIFAINDPLGSKIHVWYLNKRGYLSGELFVQSFQRPDNERSSIVGWFRHRNDGWRRCVIVFAPVCVACSRFIPFMRRVFQLNGESRCKVTEA